MKFNWYIILLFDTYATTPILSFFLSSTNFIHLLLFLPRLHISHSTCSRQRYVLGDGALQRMAQSKVLLVGLSPLGVEVGKATFDCQRAINCLPCTEYLTLPLLAAKNVALAGVQLLALCDPAVCSTRDVGPQFYIDQQDVTAGKSRFVRFAIDPSDCSPV